MDMRLIAATALSLLSYWLAPAALANGQNTFDNVDQVTQSILWKAYPAGGTELYCGKPFEQTSPSDVVAAPAYNIKQIKTALRCMTETQCTVKTPRYPFIVADLHNYFPADAEIEKQRRNASFSEFAADNQRANDIGCDTRGTYQTVEPRQEARGEIARAVLYMHAEYMLPLVGSDLAILKRWNKSDPPSLEEKTRNERIAALQGNRNPFIDNPDLADSIVE